MPPNMTGLNIIKVYYLKFLMKFRISYEGHYGPRCTGANKGNEHTFLTMS